VGSPRSGEPPIIKADNTPTKMMPAPSDASGKTLDRMPAGGDGSEKLVPREEAPVDVNSRAAGPRVVFPPLNQNANPPPPSSVSPGAMPPTAAASSNGTLPNNEPRKIRTFSVHGEQPDAAAAPVASAQPQGGAQRGIPAKQAQAAPRAQAPAAGNAPLSLSPDSAQASLPPAATEPRTRVAATNPTQTAPAAGDAPAAAEGRFLVSITSQPSESEAQSSFRAMQKKYPDQLGSRSPIIKKVDSKKGTSYRALVGPFASREEATRFCSGYSGAGGQCWVP
jgi:SPOR domain